MTTQSDPAKTGTRRMLAVAAVMCLVVLLAVLLRRGEPVVVVEAAPVAPVAAAQIPATPSPTLAVAEATVEPTALPPETHESRVTESVEEAYLVIRVAAEMEGGCELPPNTEVAFLQLMPEGTPPFVERRPLAEVTGDSGGYDLTWQTGALAVSVVVESSVGAVPGVTIDRENLDSLNPGIYRLDPIRAEEFSNPISALGLGTRAASRMLDRTTIRANRENAPSMTKERTLALSFVGSCASSVVLELPADAPLSIIDDVEVFSFMAPYKPQRYTGESPPSYERRLHFEGTRARIKFDRVPGEVRIHPLSEGTYRFVAKTTDARIWRSGDVVLSLGEERRLKVELTQSARITVRAVGASSPDAQITFRLGGIESPARYFALDRMRPGYDPEKASEHTSEQILTADQEAEFFGLNAGAYSVFARESELIRGRTPVVLRSDEHAEVVVDMRGVVPVTIEVVDAEGKPVPGPEIVIWILGWHSGSGVWGGRVDAEGKLKTSIIPGAYTLTAKGSDPRMDSTIDVKVVAPGNGDHFRIVMNGLATIHGRTVDAGGKPIQGVFVHAESILNYGWASQNSRTTSDKNGEFSIVVPRGPVDIQAAHQLWVRVARVDAPLPEGEVLEFRFESLPLRGIVLDWQTRKPVPNCIYSIQFLGGLEQQTDSFKDLPRPYGGWQGKTDARGEFEFRNLNPGFYSISASADLLGPPDVMVELRSADQPRVEVFTRGKGGTLSGTATDKDGRPISRMLLQSLYRAGSIPAPVTPNVVTDSEGNYKVTATLVGDDITAVFVQSIYDTQPRFFLAHIADGLSLREGEVTTYNFTAIGAARLMVNVTTAAGEPVRGATVRLMQGGEQVFDQARLVPGPSTTDQNGRLFFGALPAGEYRIEVTTPDGKKGAADVALAENDSPMIVIRPE